MAEETENTELTEGEKAEIKELLGYGSNIPESKQNVHTFLHNVATADDTTKLGNLKDEEIGNMQNPTRAYKHLANFSKDIMNKPGLAEYFLANSEIMTSTSLSRQGFLVDRAVIQKRELKTGDVKPPRKPSSSWFKKKGGGTEGEGGNE